MIQTVLDIRESFSFCGFHFLGFKGCNRVVYIQCKIEVLTMVHSSTMDDATRNLRTVSSGLVPAGLFQTPGTLSCK